MTESVATLQQQLNSPLLSERRGAIKSLASLPSIDDEVLSELIVSLIQLLQSDQEELVRISAAKALGQFGGSMASDALIEALQQPSHQVRVTASTALGKLRPDGAHEALHALLPFERKQSPNALLPIVKALGKILHADSMHHLLLLEEHEDEAVQGAARAALKKFGITATALAGRQDASREHAQLAELDPTLQVLVEALFDGNERQAQSASIVLGKSNKVDVLEPLIRTCTKRTHNLHAIQSFFARYEDPLERLGLLRTIMSWPLPASHMWLALCAIVDQWPQDDLAMVIPYVESHIAHWPDEVRANYFVYMSNHLERHGTPPASLPLVRKFHLYLWGEQQEHFSQLLQTVTLFSHITQLDVFRYQLDEDKLHSLFAPGSLPQLKRLAFQAHDISILGMKVLEKVIKQLPALEELSLTLTHVDKKIEALTRHRCFSLVTELVYSSNNQGEAVQSLRPLCEVIDARAPAHLTALRIENASWGSNRFEANGLHHLAKTNTWKQLKRLQLINSFAQPTRLLLLLAEGHVNHVEELSLRGNSEGDACLKALLKQTIPGLRKLDLSGCDLENSAMGQLASWHQLSTLEELDISANKCSFDGYKQLLNSPYWGPIKRLKVGQMSAKDSYAFFKLCGEHEHLHKAEICQ